MGKLFPGRYQTDIWYEEEIDGNGVEYPRLRLGHFSLGDELGVAFNEVQGGPDMHWEPHDEAPALVVHDLGVAGLGLPHLAVANLVEIGGETEVLGFFVPWRHHVESRRHFPQLLHYMPTNAIAPPMLPLISRVLGGTVFSKLCSTGPKSKAIVSLINFSCKFVVFYLSQCHVIKSVQRC